MTQFVTEMSAAIASGASGSSALYLQGKSLIGLIVPAGYSAANIAFEVSQDDNTWYRADKNGAEFQVGITAASHNILEPADFVSMEHIKLVSPATAVNGTLVFTALTRTIK